MNAERKDHPEFAALVAAGDPAPRLELVRRLERRVRVIALAILGNRADAEDAIQATWVEILSSTSTYRGDNLTAWADRISARTAMRHARQRRVRAAHTDPESDLETLLVSAPGMRFPGHEIPRPLIEYLADLPEARRVVLVLRHVLDYSIEEIAELTEVSANTVKDRLLHARSQLRRVIRRELAIAGVRGGTES